MPISSQARRERGVPAHLTESQFERVLANASRLALVGIGAVVLLVALQAGQVILAPVALAVVIGLMFGPVADWFEARGVPPALSAGFVVLLFLAIILIAVILFAVPLSEWVARGPAIWEKFKTELMTWREPLQGVMALQDQIGQLFGGSAAMTVQVEGGGGLATLALLAPAIGAQVLIFLASLYFYLATREHIRVSVLSLCVSRRMRWRTAHVFSDVEQKVSRFLLSVTLINLCVGTAVTLGMWAIGMPSPLLWGALAAVLNYIPYVGQGVMVLVLLFVGLGTQSEPGAILLPVGIYLFINFCEGQVITPHFLGRTMVLNPFLIFLSITFWLWAWGPVGGLIAVPCLLIVQSILTHVLPRKPVAPRKPVRRTARMSEKDLLLANAAQVIKEQAEIAAAAEAPPPETPAEPVPAKAERRRRKRLVPPDGTAPDGVAAKAT